ncbi:hypothetical protein [Aeromonas veronii]|uniref:hypothetical protein n=1 Tax=Aeromonas veronii TaxID=654 RepID=UPI003B9E866A
MSKEIFSIQKTFETSEKMNCVICCDEYGEHKVESSFISNIEYFHTNIFDEYENEKYNEWNSVITDYCLKTHSDLPSSLNSLITKYSERQSININLEQLSLLKLAENAYQAYIFESDNNENNSFVEPSLESLLQFLRFLPSYANTNSVYLDEKTGCFGLIMQGSASNKPTLNLLLRENKEVIFSYVKRRNKLMKISGRAYFGDHLDDSSEISKLISWLK